MLWIDLFRIIFPGILLGVVLGKVLSEKPQYLKRLIPTTWIHKIRNSSKTTISSLILFSLFFGLVLSIIMPLTRGILIENWGRSLSEENIFTQIPFSILIISITVLPIFEEWMFRGIILEEVSHKSNSTLIGLLVSSILFAVLHLSNPGTLLPALVVYFTGGIILGVSYLVGGLAVASIAHIFYNIFPYIIAIFR